VTRSDFGAFYVLSLEPDTEGINSCEGIHRSVKTMVNHSDNRHLIVKNATYLFEALLALLGEASALEIPSKLPEEFIIP